MVNNLSYPVLIPQFVRWLPEKGVIALKKLLEQLSPHQGRLASRDDLADLINSSTCFITAVADHEAFDGGHFVGIIRMVVRRRPDGQRCGEIHDEVVKVGLHRRGIGTALVIEILARARLLEVAELDLWVKPHRTEAIALYESLGFELVSPADLNVVGSANHYRLEL